MSRRGDSAELILDKLADDLNHKCRQLFPAHEDFASVQNAANALYEIAASYTQKCVRLDLDLQSVSRRAAITDSICGALQQKIDDVEEIVFKTPSEHSCCTAWRQGLLRWREEIDRLTKENTQLWAVLKTCPSCARFERGTLNACPIQQHISLSGVCNQREEA